MQVLAALYGTPYPISPLEQTMMTVSLNTEQDRVDAYTRAQKAVEGIFPDPLETYPDEPRDIVKVNLIKPIVDATVNYLFGKPPEWQIPKEQDVSLGDDATMDEGMNMDMAGMSAMMQQGQGQGQQPLAGSAPMPMHTAMMTPRTAVKTKSPEEEYLEECLRLNRWPTFLLDIGLNGATCGTPYYALDTDRRLPNRTTPAKPYPRFYAVDPACMSVRADPRDITQVIRYEWRYLSYDDRMKRPTIERKVYTRGEGGGYWTIAREVAYFTGGLTSTTLYGSAMLDTAWQPLEAPVIWPYDWPPIDHCKNLPAPNQVYGAPDVTDTLIEANNAINFNLSNRQRIDKFHGHPLLFLENFNGDIKELDLSVGSVTGLPSTGTNPVHVVQISPSVDSTATSQLKGEIYDSMLEESATPSIVLGAVSRENGPPSGVALRMRLQPMLQKTETKRKLYEPFLQELIRRLFVLGGFADDIVVSMIWPELVPIDNLEERQALQIDSTLGVASKETISAKLGYEWEDEQAKIEQEKAASVQRAQQNVAAMGGGMAMMPSTAPAAGDNGQQPPQAPSNQNNGGGGNMGNMGGMMGANG